MKILILAACLFIGFAAAAQQQFKVTILKTSETIELKDDNNGKQLKLSTTYAYGKKNYLSVTSLQPGLDKEFKRFFTITDAADAEIATIDSTRLKGVYEVPLQQLAKKMKKGNIYKIYTMAIPADPAKAAVVRVRPMLLCSIYAQ
jgi:hypothetical protein